MEIGIGVVTNSGDGFDNLTGQRNTQITGGKNFKEHYIRHKKILQNVTGNCYGKYKTDSQNFLNDIGKVIDDGQVKYDGLGTLKKGEPAMKIYRGNGVTIVTTTGNEFVTILESGVGMDLAIQMIP